MIPIGTYMRDSNGLYFYRIVDHIFINDFKIRGYVCLCWDVEIDSIRVMRFHEQTMLNDKKMNTNEVQKFEERIGKENEQ